MQILEDSRAKLQIKNSPSLGMRAFMTIWGSLFAGVPLIIMVFLAKDLGVINVRCDRPEPSLVSCDYQRSSYMGLVQQSAQSYSGVTQAQLSTEEGYDSESGGTTYEHWVSLETSQGSVRLVEASIMVNGVKGDPQQLGAIAQHINDFIQSSETELTFQRDSRFLPANLSALAFVGLFPLTGLLVLYCVFQTEELTFNRELGLLQRRRKTFLGLRSQDLAMHNITGTHIDTSRSDSGTTYHLKLEPKSLRTRTLLSSHYWSEVNDIRQKINRFINAT